MKENIRDVVLRYIHRDGQARFDVRDGRAGVVFFDEEGDDQPGNFIPLSELAYNGEVGFYSTVALPDVEPETTNENLWTLHPVIPAGRDDPWRPYALLDPDGYGHLLGEKWQVVEAAEAIRVFLERGLMSEPIAEDDEALGTRWLTIQEAMEEANRFDPEEYKLDENLANRIRMAARRGAIGGVAQDPSNRYKFQARRFRYWLVKNQKRNQENENAE